MCLKLSPKLYLHFNFVLKLPEAGKVKVNKFNMFKVYFCFTYTFKSVKPEKEINLCELSVVKVYIHFFGSHYMYTY